MFKYTIVLFALIAVALAAPKPEPKPDLFAAAPILPALPLPTSYSNSYHISYKAPIIQAAPLLAPAPALLTYGFI
uniref:Uncharacterized protein n=1 Tax=Bracon brevicornis TaxID=1563983 RepID=A0A6V7K3T9_9HYME